MKNLYLSSAEFYDIDTYHLANHDIGFYLDYARKMLPGEPPGELLELACGTGRVSLPLAEAGFRVRGIDLSAPMLSVFKRKLSAAPREVAARVRLEQADMADFDLGRDFELIIVPFRAFQALTTEERVRSALLSIKRHLSPTGLLIIDLFRPRWRMDGSWASAVEQFDWSKTIRETGQTVVRSEIRRRIDTARQIIYPEIIYRVEERSGERTTVCEPLELRYYYQYQMEVLLICSGFKIEESFGYYDRRSTDEGSELIFVAGRGDREPGPLARLPPRARKRKEGTS